MEHLESQTSELEIAISVILLQLRGDGLCFSPDMG